MYMSIRKQSKAKHTQAQYMLGLVKRDNIGKKKHSRRKGIPEGPVVQTVLAEVANATKLRGIGNVTEL